MVIYRVWNKDIIMCITVSRNKIIVHDTNNIDNADNELVSTIASPSQRKVMLMDDVYNVDEYPEEWEQHIVKHEYCALLREQLDNVMSAKAKSDKAVFKNSLLNLIKAAMITYNNIKKD